MENEQWKPVVGFEGLYEISSIGRVMRVGATVSGRKPPYILKPRHSTDGYIQSTLANNGVVKQVTNHRLVAAAFLGYDRPYLQVNHRNGVRDDNRVENLEWVTIRENLHHSYSVLNRKVWRKLTNDQVADIKYRSSLGVSNRRLARDFGVVQHTIIALLKGRIVAYRDIPLAKYVRM